MDWSLGREAAGWWAGRWEAGKVVSFKWRYIHSARHGAWHGIGAESALLTSYQHGLPGHAGGAVNKVYMPGGIAGQPPGLPDIYVFCGSPQQRAERPCPAFPSHSAALPDCMRGAGHSRDRAGHQAPTEMHLG